MSRSLLDRQVLASADARLADTDAFLARTYPGEDGVRQPVHTVYLPAHRFSTSGLADWGSSARAAVAQFGGAERLCAQLGLGPAAGVIGARVADKLDREPIEDLRVDFEDGYGDHADEDDEVVRVGTEVARLLADGSCPPFVGIRFKCFEAPTRARGLRTLDLFLCTLLEHGSLPDGLRLTLPKVSTVSQVEVMVDVCAAFEQAAGLPEGRLRFEIQVETPQLIMAADGSSPLAAALHAGAGRVTGLHYGTYDYSASLQIAAGYQSMEHPAADHAKAIMQLAAAGTGVQLSDGSTNVLPVGEAVDVLAAWRLHLRLVRRSLERAFYQGWDMHPAQLPTRFIANYSFYRDGFEAAAARLSGYVGHTTAGVLDEPATARALARYLHRGYLCGATGADELVAATGLAPDALERLARPHSDTEQPPG